MHGYFSILPFFLQRTQDAIHGTDQAVLHIQALTRLRPWPSKAAISQPSAHALVKHTFISISLFERLHLKPTLKRLDWKRSTALKVHLHSNAEVLLNVTVVPYFVSGFRDDSCVKTFRSHKIAHCSSRKPEG